MVPDSSQMESKLAELTSTLLKRPQLSLLSHQVLPQLLQLLPALEVQSTGLMEQSMLTAKDISQMERLLMESTTGSLKKSQLLQLKQLPQLLQLLQLPQLPQLLQLRVQLPH